MRGQPDAVPGSVDEVLAVTGVGDHLARRAVDLLALDARPHRLEAGLLRAPHELVDLALLVGRLADVDGAGRVRAVAVLDAAEVEDDHVAFLDHTLVELVVGVGAVRARADDGEVDLRMPVVAEEAGEVGGDLALAATRELTLGDLLEARVGGRAGGGEPLELVRVLDRAQHRQRARHRNVRRVGQRLLQCEHVHRPGRVGDRVPAVWVEQLGRRGVRVASVRPVGQRQGGSRREQPRRRGARESERSSTGGREACSASMVIRSVIAIGW